MLAETRPDWVYVDLGILGAGGVSGGIHPAMKPNSSARRCSSRAAACCSWRTRSSSTRCLLVRDDCPALQRIVIFDMKGLRDFADPMCESLQVFIAARVAEAHWD